MEAVSRSATTLDEVAQAAGVSAVLARVKYGGSFRVTTRIPATKRPGRYGVTARCAGGNLGVLKHLTVRR